eukprot:6056762-Pleurochrysis_carterae.AAC.1
MHLHPERRADYHRLARKYVNQESGEPISLAVDEAVGRRLGRRQVACAPRRRALAQPVGEQCAHAPVREKLRWVARVYKHAHTTSTTAPAGTASAGLRSAPEKISGLPERKSRAFPATSVSCVVSIAGATEACAAAAKSSGAAKESRCPFAAVVAPLISLGLKPAFALDAGSERLRVGIVDDVAL